MESRRFFLGQLIEPLLNAVFPRYCVSCKQEGSLLCPSCFAAFDDRVFRVEENHLTMFAYGNPIIRDLIKAYKYDFDHSAFRILQRLAEPNMQIAKQFVGEAILVPVPLSSLRLRERGFNQAEEFARWVARTTQTEIRDLLKREERKGHQAEKTPEERAAAMTDSPFRMVQGWSDASPFQGDRGGLGVVLLDDVWTTGSTMRAAEKTLRENGVEKIQFLTLAKG